MRGENNGKQTSRRIHHRSHTGSCVRCVAVDSDAERKRSKVAPRTPRPDLGTWRGVEDTMIDRSTQTWPTDVAVHVPETTCPHLVIDQYGIDLMIAAEDEAEYARRVR